MGCNCSTRFTQFPLQPLAVIYNWWTLFTRLAIPNRHTEAITSRPLLLNGVARQTVHSNQTTLTMTSIHAQAPAIRRVLQAVSTFLRRVRTTAEQFTPADRWRAVVRFIYRDWLGSAGGPQPEFASLLS